MNLRKKRKIIAILVSVMMVIAMMPLFAYADEATTSLPKPNAQVKVDSIQQGTMNSDYGELKGDIASFSVTVDKQNEANMYFVAALRRNAPGSNYAYDKMGSGNMPTILANPNEKAKFEDRNPGLNGEKVTETEKTIIAEKKVCKLNGTTQDPMLNHACYKEGEKIIVEVQSLNYDGNTTKQSESVFIEVPFDKSSVGKTFKENGVVEGGSKAKESGKNDSGNKLENPMTVKCKKSIKIKAAKLKKKSKVIKGSKIFTVKDAQGTIKYAKVKSKKTTKIKVNNKTGNITLKKGLKKGTYKVKVNITASGNNKYEKVKKQVVFKVRVK